MHQRPDNTSKIDASNQRKLAGVTIIVSFLSLAGKLLGIARSVILAAIFGASASLDAFWIAYMIPMMLPSILRNLVMTAFIPQFMKSLDGSNEREKWDGANALFTILFLLILSASVLMFAAAPYIIKLISPGLSDQTQELAVILARIMIVSSIFMALNSILSAIAFSLNKFLSASLESFVTNIVTITMVLLWSKQYGIHILAISVVVGFFIQFLIQLKINFHHVKHYLRISFNIKHRDFIESIQHMLPLTVGLVSAWLMGMVDKIFASYLQEGSISALSYAETISWLPVEIFATAIMTTFFPQLSRQYANRNMAEMAETQLKGLRVLIIIMLPFTVLFILFATQIVGFLLQRGSFTEQSTLLTSSAVICLSIGILARSISYFNYRFIHAIREPWTQVKIGLIGVVTNICFNAILIKPFGLAGVALATSIALIQSSILSTLVVQKKLGIKLVFKLLQPLSISAVLAIGMGSIAFLISNIVNQYISVNHTTSKFLVEMSGIPIAVVLVTILGVLFKQREILFMYTIVKEKILRTK